MTVAPSLPARTLIVEDIAATRDWLSGLVHRAFPATGVYHATTLAEARAWVKANPESAHPESSGDTLFLIDLGLPDGTGVDLIRDLATSHPGAQLVVSTIFDDDAHLMQAMAAGAHSYLLKDRPAEELVELLRRIGRGEVALSPPMARRLLAHFRGHATFVTAGASNAAGEEQQLTARETDVLRLIGRGLTLAEAGGALAISAQTVATHVKAIYRKLGITSRAEAALEAARRKLT
ncbi:MAG: response regulator transcription factor [Sphingomonadales bacterium]|nr:response regulator transcription factor [Sphingomonadales bacterium]